MTIQEAARQLNIEYSQITKKDKTLEEKIQDLEKIIENLSKRLENLENNESKFH